MHYTSYIEFFLCVASIPFANESLSDSVNKSVLSESGRLSFALTACS